MYVAGIHLHLVPFSAFTTRGPYACDLPRPLVASMTVAFDQQANKAGGAAEVLHSYLHLELAGKGWLTGSFVLLLAGRSQANVHRDCSLATNHYVPGFSATCNVRQS